MIFDYAVDPGLVARWAVLEEARLVVKAFGLGQPHVVSIYPGKKKWRAILGQPPAGLRPVEVLRWAELVKALTSVMGMRFNWVPYEDTLDWLTNALREHSRLPFAALLARSNPGHHVDVLVADSLVGLTDPRLSRPVSGVVERKARKMAQAVEVMLRTCNEVHLVDPYFTTQERRFRDPLLRFLEAAASGRNASPALRVTVHSKAPEDGERFRAACRDKIAPYLPPCIELFLKQIADQGDERLHNRYILTDIGGVTFGVGLDESNSRATDDVSLLSKDQYQLRWSQYCGQSPAFAALDRVGPLRRP